MSTPGGLVDKQELIDAQLDTAHLGRVVNSKDASGAPINTSTNRTGGVNKTLDALEAEYIEAIQGAGGVPVGTWTQGVTTFTKYNEYAVYNGIPYKPRTSATLPYVAQGSDPTTPPDDANVQPYQEITEAQVVAVVEETVPGLVSGANLISNALFEVAGSVANAPDATPRSYSADDELFQGFKAVGALSGVTCVNGKLNGTGQLYVDVYKTEKQKLSTVAHVASIASSDGVPVESGASFVDNGDYWRVTFDMNDTFSVKLEQGLVATGHSVATDVGSNTTYNLNEMGLVENSNIDQTANFNSYWDRIPRGSKVTVNAGTYIISGGLIDSHHKTILTAKGFVEFVHPLEMTTGRTITKKNILIQNTNLMKIYGVNTRGRHTDSVNGDDNSYQSGISYENCDSCKTILCSGENLQRVFIDSSSRSNKYEMCSGKTTYNSFLSTNNSSKTKWSNCDSYDAYWAKQLEPDPSATLAAGYGFLIDSSTNCKASDCSSTKSGSDCFRSSGLNSRGAKFVNCESFSPRRNSFSHRSSTAKACKSLDCDAFDVGDISFWTGSSGTYTEKANNARAHYILGNGVSVKGGSVSNDVNPLNSNMSEIIFIDDSSDSIIEGIIGEGAVYNSGVYSTPNSSDCQVIGNNIIVQELSVLDSVYPYNIDGTGHQISNNKSKGGQDGYLITASDTDVTDNASSLAARHGFSINGNSCVFDGNRAYNPNTLNTNGVGFFWFGKDITCGTNTAIDDRTPNRISQAAWISSNATGLFSGQLINRSTSPDVRDESTISTRASAKLGKGVPATDIATLLSSLEGAELIQS